jgi:hypothetical protein
MQELEGRYAKKWLNEKVTQALPTTVEQGEDK